MNYEFLSSVFLLLILLDPLGNIPFLLSLLRDIPKERRRWVILRECLIATTVLIIFVFVGDIIFKAMRLSESALEISGGLMLFVIAMRMVFPPTFVAEVDRDSRSEPFIVPLAIPMIVGPSVLATVLLASRQSTQPFLLIAAILLASCVNFLVLLGSDHFSKLLGKSGLEAFERLMGLVLVTMSVQMIISGIKNAFNL